MLGLNSELESSCLPGQLRYIIHFLHAFDSDAVDLPLRPIANRFGGCFCLGSGPVFCVLVCFRAFASLFPLAKRKSGWGICGSSFLVWLCFSFCCSIDLLILRTFLSLYSVLSAYSHVRTEPLVRHRPHSRKKKIALPCVRCKHLLRSAWVNIMPVRLLFVISGILAGGIPGFRIEPLLLLSPDVALCCAFASFCCVFYFGPFSG